VTNVNQVIGIGDFLQLSPVAYPKQGLTFQARSWDEVFPTVVRLATVQRQVDQGKLPHPSRAGIDLLL
jgi:hypothetical protein